MEAVWKTQKREIVKLDFWFITYSVTLSLGSGIFTVTFKKCSCTSKVSLSFSPLSFFPFFLVFFISIFFLILSWFWDLIETLHILKYERLIVAKICLHFNWIVRAYTYSRAALIRTNWKKQFWVKHNYLSFLITKSTGKGKPKRTLNYCHY